MASNSDVSREPIGYWLRRGDQLISQYTNRVLAAEGLTRLHWQLLNILAEHDDTTNGVLARMSGFVDLAGLQGLIADLVRRGWLGEEAARGRLQLSAQGRESHARVLDLMLSVRERSLRGVGTEEYAAVVGTLKRLCSNLEEALRDA
jgi:DNA-binding MarR family transcriptional regulator